MIARIWHGWTLPENAISYEQLLKEEIFNNIRKKNIDGFNGIELLKRSVDNETEFTTIIYLGTIDAIKKFAGEDYEKAVVPEKAQKLLRYDDTSQHYEIIKQRQD